MENATYALKIAGGILIALMVLSVVMYGFRKLRTYEQAKSDSIAVEQTAEFNKPLLSFNNQIVSGFKMISLANLANDTNVRFSRLIDDYKEVQIYVGLLNKNGQLPGWTNYDSTSDYVKLVLSNSNNSTSKSYYNMINYVGKTGEGPYYRQNKNGQKSFKDLYFQCIDVKYDQTTGRVIQMVFEEVKKRN